MAEKNLNDGLIDYFVAVVEKTMLWEIRFHNKGWLSKITSCMNTSATLGIEKSQI